MTPQLYTHAHTHTHTHTHTQPANEKQFHSKHCVKVSVGESVFVVKNYALSFVKELSNVWNNLSVGVNFSSINTFKRSINSVDFSRFVLRNFFVVILCCFYVLLF